MKKKVYVDCFNEENCVTGSLIDLRFNKLYFSKEEWDKIDLTNKMIEIDFPEKKADLSDVSDEQLRDEIKNRLKVDGRFQKEYYRQELRRKWLTAIFD